MDDEGPEPLDYAKPDRQPMPGFTIHWGGWIMLAIVLTAIALIAFEHFRFT